MALYDHLKACREYKCYMHLSSLQYSQHRFQKIRGPFKMSYDRLSSLSSLVIKQVINADRPTSFLALGAVTT